MNRRGQGTIICTWILLACLPLTAAGQAQPDPELDAHIQTRLAFIQDRARSVSARASALLELAATLDRAAHAAANPRIQANLWLRAEDLLAAFDRQQSFFYSERDQIILQQAVAAWAQARVELALRDRTGDDPAASDRAISPALERAIARLIGWIAPQPEIEANRAYRLAHAWYDRATVSSDPLLRSIDLEAAQRMLRTSPAYPPVDGHAALLASQIARELGQWASAEHHLARADRAPQPPPAHERVLTRASLFIAHREFDHAEKLLAQADLPETERQLCRLDIALARLASAELPTRERARREQETIQLAEQISTAQPELFHRLSTRIIQVIPRPADPHDALIWLWLVRAQHRLKHLDRAATLAAQATASLEPAHQPTESSAPIRLEAARVALDAGQSDIALTRLAPLLDQPPASIPSALQEQASWLDLLVRSRVLERERSAAARNSFLHALETLIKRFPDQSRTHQARLVLAQERLRDEQPDQARMLWSQIPPASPEWIAAQLARFDHAFDTILAHLEQERETTARETWSNTVAWVEEARLRAPPSSDNAIRLDLARFWLELLPPFGELPQAKRLLDRTREADATRAQVLPIEPERIALRIAQGDLLAAERQLAAWLPTAPVAQAYALARWLAGWLRVTTSDRIRQRAGPLLLTLAEHFPDRAWPCPLPVSQAFAFRMSGQSAAGDRAGALQSWKAWQASEHMTPADRLRGAAILLAQGSTTDALTAYRSLERSVDPASEAWYLARLGILRSLLRSTRHAEATRLLQATRILHPELGGPRFQPLFQDLERDLNRRSRGSRS